MTSTATEQVFELRCSSQNYLWGKIGMDSEVASLLNSADPSVTVDPNTTYAELWMGTHPSCPSLLNIPGQPNCPLDKWIQEHPDALGETVKEKFGTALPFLFKVLSVNTALSIQAHPNKQHAEELHRRDPKNYKDANHKPEMTIALTDFRGLCGFRPISELAQFVKDIEELREVIGAENAKKIDISSSSKEAELQNEALRCAFTSLMTADTDLVKTQLHKLVDRVKQMESQGKDTSSLVGDILLKLDQEFPGDVGGFSIYFLNLIRLRKGEAIFLQANLPHAYLSGDCMECMACSDNVVRAGLTPKYIDTETLLGMLDYQGKSAEENKFLPTDCEEGGCKVRHFNPSIADFAVTQIQVPADTQTASLVSMSSASIVICIEGNASLTNATLNQPIQVRRGTILFIAANQEAVLNVTSANGMLFFRAHAGC